MPSRLPTRGPLGPERLQQEGYRPRGASPPFAGDEADVIGLAVGVDPPRLPPLLVTGIDHMQHVPETEAQGLAQEAAVLGLVIVKQGPGGRAADGQRQVEAPHTPRPRPGL